MAVSDWDNSRGDVFARGHAMAHGAILAELLKLITAKGVLTQDEVRTMLTDLMGMFRQPMATDHQSVAAATVLQIRENVLEASP
jgi:hypothetical protein